MARNFRKATASPRLLARKASSEQRPRMAISKYKTVKARVAAVGYETFGWRLMEENARAVEAKSEAITAREAALSSFHQSEE